MDKTNRQTATIARLTQEVALQKAKEDLARRLTQENVGLRTQVEEATKEKEAMKEKKALEEKEKALRSLRRELAAVKEKAETKAAAARLEETEARRVRARQAFNEASASNRQLQAKVESLKAEARARAQPVEEERVTLHIKCEGNRMTENRLEYVDSEESFTCFVGPNTTCIHVNLKSSGGVKVKGKNMKWCG